MEHAPLLTIFRLKSIATKFSRLLLVFALLVSIGGHWALLQSVAWTQMLVARSQTGSLVEAVKTTFDGAHPCSLCKRIADGHDEERPPAQSSAKVKLDFVIAPQSTLICVSVAAMGWPLMEKSARPRAEQPSLPPPRTA